MLDTCGITEFLPNAEWTRGHCGRTTVWGMIVFNDFKMISEYMASSKAECRRSCEELNSPNVNLTAEDEVLSRNENRSPVNLSVDYDLWQQFIDKIRFQYGKKKIQTEVLDMIIENYLETYDQL